jgi:hypothetical protein
MLQNLENIHAEETETEIEATNNKNILFSNNAPEIPPIAVTDCRNLK